MTNRMMILSCAAFVAAAAVSAGALHGCGKSALTPDEAEQELDVACGVLERSLAQNKNPLPEALAVRLCSGKFTRSIIERALEGVNPLPLVTHFDSDAGL